MFNNLGTPLSKLQINCGVLQIDTENSATGSIDIASNLQDFGGIFKKEAFDNLT